MTLSTAPVVGAPDQEHWPQVFHYALDAHTVFVAAVCIKDKKKTRESGRRFIESLQKLPFEDTAALSTALQELSANDHYVVESFAGALIGPEKAFLWSWNNGRVCLSRGSKKGAIIDSTPFKVVAGAVKPGDVYLVGTDGFFRAVPLWSTLHGAVAEELADQAIILLQKADQQSTSAGYLVVCHPGKDDHISAREEKLLPVETDEEDAEEAVVLAERAGDSIRGISGVMHAVRTKTLGRFDGIHMRGGTAEDKKKTALVRLGLISIIVLFILAWLWSGYQARQREKTIGTLLQPFQQQLDLAKKEYATNPASARDRAHTVIITLQAEQTKAKKKSYEEAQLQRLIAEAQAYYDSISGEKRLASLSLFYNFQLVKSAFIAKRVAIEGDVAVFLDPQGSAVRLDLKSKQPSVIESAGISEARDIAVLNKKTYVLGSGEKGIGVYAEGTLVSPEVKAEDNPTILRLFGSSLYIFMKNSGELVKFVAAGSTFGEGTNWFRQTQGVERKNIVSIAIDGKVWVTTTKGEIFAFAQGSRQSFSITGMLTPFAGSTSIYTTPDLPFLYVLEPGQHRLVVLDKNGVYQKQFVSDDMAAVTDLIISQDGKTANLLAGSVVYSLSLE